MYRKYLILSGLFILLTSQFTFSQVSTDQPMSKQFEEAMTKSETYNQYKVIPIKAMRSLIKGVQDSLDAKSVEIVNLNNTITGQQILVDSLAGNIESLTSELQASNEVNDSISFLGIPFTKAIYHVFVWAIIGALFIGIAVVFMMFKRSNSITRTTVKELRDLTIEFDSHKTKAHERQVKLKRELQTAVNALNERGISV